MTAPATTRTRERPALAVGAVLLLAAVLLVVASRHRNAPIIFADEAGTLGNARWLTGGPLWDMGRSSSTDIAYPLLLAPLTLLAPDPEALYRAVVLLNVAFAVGLLAVLYALVRRGLGAGRGRALAAAACGVAYPAVAVQVGVAWVEVTAMLGVAVLLTSAVLAARQLTTTLLVVHGATSAFLFCLHGRFTPLPVLTLGALVAVAVLRPAARRGATFAVAATVTVVVVLRWLQHAVQQDRWEVLVHPEVNAAQVLGLPLHAVLRSVSGQGWYLLAGTGGLVLLGVVQLLRTALVRSDEDGVGGRALAMYVGLVVAGILGISVATLTTGLSGQDVHRRVDYLYYGRYNECLVPTLVCLGVAAALDPRLRRVAATCLASAALLGPLLLGVALLTSRDLTFGNRVQLFMMTALDPLLSLDERNVAAHGRWFVLLPAAVAVAVTLLLAALVLLRRWLVPLVVLVLFVTVAVADLHRLGPQTGQVEARAPLFQQLRDLHPEVVAYDRKTVTTRAFYEVPFWLDDSRFERFDSTSADWPEADLFIGPARWPAAEERGLRLVEVDPLTGRGFFVPA